MKVKPKYLSYENLPCKGCKKKLMADYGMNMGPGPTMPNLYQSIQDYYEGDSPVQMNPSMPRISTDPRGAVSTSQLPAIDTGKVKPGKFLGPKDLQPPNSKQAGMNWGNAALIGMTAFDAGLPNPYKRHYPVQPQMVYNPTPYGTGSQAIMEYGGYMEDGGTDPMPLYKPKDTSLPNASIRLGDRNVDRSTIEKIISSSRRNKIDPYEALAIAYQESGIDKTSPYHLNPDYFGTNLAGPEAGVENIAAQMKYAKSMQDKGIVPNTDVYRLQGYNGYGKIGRGHADLEGANKIYGQEIPKGGIDFKKNPLYGQRIMDIMTNTLKPNSEIRALMDKGNYGYYIGEDENNSPSAKNGMVIKSTLADKLIEAKDGHWIQKAVNPKHKGYCTPMTKSTCTPRRKALAKTFKKHHGFHKNGGKLAPGDWSETERNDAMSMITADMDMGGFIQPGYDKYKKGGIIPDNMSVFSPHQYANGGSARGGSDTTDLLEQWVAWRTGTYKNGGTARGGSDTTDLLEQWIPWMTGEYKNGGLARGGSDTTDLIEQWIPWMTGEYAQGGTLSSDKAKEMLKDGTAHGKKLTKKQKQYFGMVAAGKAAFGDLLSGDPTKPSLVKPQPYDPRHGSIAGTNAFGALAAMDRPQMETAKGIDLVNESIRSGVLPHMMDKNRAKSYRDLLDPKMYNYLYEFNNRSDLKGMTPDQRMQTFYNIQSNDPAIQSMKDNIKRYGYGTSEFQRNAPVAMPTPGTIAGMANGGVMYDDGGQINTMWGGNANLESYNPYDGGTVEFNGDSHAQGGIGMQYNGNPVEVEGGEYAARDNSGNLTIYGNMYVPGTKTKFKQAAKAIADKEKRYDMLNTKGADLVNDANPASKFEQLKFNAGRVMMQGGKMGMEDLASKKERLASLQKSMLDMAEAHGLDPHAMSQGKMKKAKGGASIPFYEDGGTDPGNDPTRADRNNNPGNIKYGKLAQKYGAKTDKDGFAVFPDRKTGEKAMRDLLTSKGYRDMSAKDAINKWTGGHPYRYDLGPLTDKKISEMDPDELSIVMGTMTKGEGTRYGVRPSTPRPTPNTPKPEVPNPGPFTPYTLPDIPLTSETPGTKPGKVKTPYDELQIPERGKLPSNVEPLHLNQILPELYGIATNKVEPVPSQRFEPQLYSPYQVSFQDRLNQNQATLNAGMRAVGTGANNPAAIGTLAAQKYQADQATLGDEFRTNQAIRDDITNKNVALVNDANMKNLGIADTQMVRQSEARSKTRQFNQMILNSLSDKYAKNEFENKRLAAYENLYDYRFVPQTDGGMSATYFGPNAMFNYSGASHNDFASPSRTITRYDAAGNLTGSSQYDDSELRDYQKMLQVMKLQRSLPLMPLQPLK